MARLNLSHGSHEEHERVYRMVREAADAERPRGRPSSPTCRARRSASARSRTAPRMLENGDEFTITTRDVPGDATVCSTTYDGLPGDVAPGDPILIDDGRVRLEVLSVDGTDVLTRVVVAGPVSDHKGINLPGRGRLRSGHVREGRGRPALGAASQRRLRRAVVRAVGGRRRGRARDHEGGGRPPPGHREDREAAGHREHRGDRRRVRRLHGRPRRPRRGVSAGGRAVPAEAGDRGRAPAREAGDRRDADARVDDLLTAADPRRGLRRRQRGARRRRRRDALRRDERGEVPDRHGGDDGAASSSPPRTTGWPAWRPSTGSRAPAAA